MTGFLRARYRLSRAERENASTPNTQSRITQIRGSSMKSAFSREGRPSLETLFHLETKSYHSHRASPSLTIFINKLREELLALGLAAIVQPANTVRSGYPKPLLTGRLGDPGRVDSPGKRRLGDISCCSSARAKGEFHGQVGQILPHGDAGSHSRQIDQSGGCASGLERKHGHRIRYFDGSVVCVKLTP